VEVKILVRDVQQLMDMKIKLLFNLEEDVGVEIAKRFYTQNIYYHFIYLKRRIMLKCKICQLNDTDSTTGICWECSWYMFYWCYYN